MISGSGRELPWTPSRTCQSPSSSSRTFFAPRPAWIRIHAIQPGIMLRMRHLGEHRRPRCKDQVMPSPTSVVLASNSELWAMIRRTIRRCAHYARGTRSLLVVGGEISAGSVKQRSFPRKIFLRLLEFFRPHHVSFGYSVILGMRSSRNKIRNELIGSRGGCGIRVHEGNFETQQVLRVVTQQKVTARLEQRKRNRLPNSCENPQRVWVHPK